MSTPFNLPTISTSIAPVITVTATFATGATGTLMVTGSTDGGSTFTPVTPFSGTPASLTANGVMCFVQQPDTIYRVERTGGSGSISAVASALLCGIVTGTLSMTSAAASFVKPLAASDLLPVITVATAFANGTTGSIALTASTDGGTTYSATTGTGGSPTTLTADGTITVQRQANTLYRLEGTITGRGANNNGTLNYIVSAPLPPFNVPITSAITLPVLCGFVLFNSGAGTVTLTASTDGGQTFSPVTENGAVLPAVSNPTVGQTGGFNLLQQPNTVYRLEVAFSSPGSLYYFLSSGGISGTPVMSPAGFVLTNEPFAVTPIILLNGGIGTIAQVQKLYDTVRVPLADADLSGALTAYKSCTYGTLAADGSYTPAGNAVAKLSIPAAAQRARQQRSHIGFDRMIRAEYADVISVVKEDGTAIAAGYSYTDPPAKVDLNGTAVAYAGTRYVPGQRTTLRDAPISGTITGAGATALSLPATATSSPVVFQVAVRFTLGAVDAVTVTASTDGGSTWAPVTSAMVIVEGSDTYAPVSPAVITKTGVIRVLQQPNTLYRLERTITTGTVQYFAGALSSHPLISLSDNLGPAIGNSTGAFTAATNHTGIGCYLTLIEAATCGALFAKSGENHAPDLTALGA